MDNSLIEAELKFQIKALKDENEKLKRENSKLRISIRELDPSFDPNEISEVQALCEEQIRKLKEESAVRELTTDEIKKLDILHKNWKLSKGEDIKVSWEKKAETLTDQDLERIVGERKVEHE